ncbi:hypothetical protein ACF1AE_04060 [Streptomyces sp. NPDC014986]|uniref:hypothetical protein n=1 Tax=Streptomyces sp. NPDC014986 TaxID=3364934 RepID=UPI0037009B77
MPADGPEADGTPARESTTVVIAEVSAGDATGTGWTYGPPVIGGFLNGYLAPLVEGRSALDIPAVHDAMCHSVRDTGGTAAPGAGPGHGPTLRTEDVARYRVG